ncbi:hypothetical protein PHLGIDRAFT_348799 [Phlebiopsis gigantea 11061_1 CR5-6]|uniref:Uncharacterized protein n=1 Tax=Phlebiopsis gigantea (strain 11061_1 CR5-6) TaxID=745531 RepID=A0A0C3RPQ3_PHLG1|nr:hypothetical protein PHLGIDRAFT_348799 [Phlebiopsis gigantea 11061_1 CR5-6]
MFLGHSPCCDCFGLVRGRCDLCPRCADRRGSKDLVRRGHLMHAAECLSPGSAQECWQMCALFLFVVQARPHHCQSVSMRDVLDRLLVLSTCWPPVVALSWDLPSPQSWCRLASPSAYGLTASQRIDWKYLFDVSPWIHRRLSACLPRDTRKIEGNSCGG